MLSLGSLRHPRDLARINLLCDQASPIILAGLLAIVDFHNYLLIQQSNGGSDLVSADIPKGLMLLQGQNPYSVQPWASPYPPLLLFIVSGIILLILGCSQFNAISCTTTLALRSTIITAVGAVLLASTWLWPEKRKKIPLKSRFKDIATKLIGLAILAIIFLILYYLCPTCLLGGA